MGAAAHAARTPSAPPPSHPAAKNSAVVTSPAAREANFMVRIRLRQRSGVRKCKGGALSTHRGMQRQKAVFVTVCQITRHAREVALGTQTPHLLRADAPAGI